MKGMSTGCSLQTTADILASEASLAAQQQQSQSPEELQAQQPHRRQMDVSTYEFLAPTAEQKALMDRLRAAAHIYSTILEDWLPDGPDKDFCIRSIRTTAMWANVALTRHADGRPRR